MERALLNFCRRRMDSKPPPTHSVTQSKSKERGGKEMLAIKGEKKYGC